MQAREIASATPGVFRLNKSHFPALEFRPAFLLTSCHSPSLFPPYLCVYIYIPGTYASLYGTYTLTLALFNLHFYRFGKELSFVLPYSLDSHKIPIKMSTHKQPTQARKAKQLGNFH